MPLEFPSDTRRRPSREEHFVLEDLPDRERMLFGSIAYVFFPAALYFARWDPLVRFHVRQSAGLAVGLVLARVWARFAWNHEIPEVSWLGYVGVTVAACYGIRNAIALEYRPFPWFGWLAHKLPLPKHLGEKPLMRGRSPSQPVP